MKKLIISASVFLLMATSVPVHAVENTANLTKTEQANVLIARLNEINEVEKSTLTFKQKRAMRKEVRHINKELRQINGGVYLSVGAIIIILLLLILLL